LSELNMSGMSKATRHAAGILMSIIAVGLGLIMTYAIFSDPNVGGIIGTATDRFTVKMTLSLAVWAGVAIPLLGIWSGILESKKQEPVKATPEYQTEGYHPTNEYRSSSSYEETASGGQVLKTKKSYRQTAEEHQSELKPGSDDYHGEMPKRRRKGYD
jgi:hypothetical protein